MKTKFDAELKEIRDLTVDRAKMENMYSKVSSNIASLRGESEEEQKDADLKSKTVVFMSENTVKDRTVRLANPTINKSITPVGNLAIDALQDETIEIIEEPEEKTIEDTEIYLNENNENNKIAIIDFEELVKQQKGIELVEEIELEAEVLEEEGRFIPVMEKISEKRANEHLIHQYNLFDKSFKLLIALALTCGLAAAASKIMVDKLLPENDNNHIAQELYIDNQYIDLPNEVYGDYDLTVQPNGTAYYYDGQGQKFGTFNGISAEEAVKRYSK